MAAADVPGSWTGRLLSQSLLVQTGRTSYALYLWHLPVLTLFAYYNVVAPTALQISFLIAGILFWTPAIATPRRGSGWSVPVYLFLATLPCDALSAYLVFCGHVVYPSYGSGGQLFRLSPLDDQALAGALMWVVVTFAYLIPALVLTRRSRNQTGKSVTMPKWASNF